MYAQKNKLRISTFRLHLTPIDETSEISVVCARARNDTCILYNNNCLESTTLPDIFI